MNRLEGVVVKCWVRERGNPSPLSLDFENSAFAVQISNGEATITFKDPIASLELAERHVNEYLRSWVADGTLQTSSTHRDIRIHAITSTNGGAVYFGPTATGTVTGPLAEANTRRYFPWRRHEYYDDPLVASLIARYEDYRRGRERLAVLAFLCLSALERTFGGRPGVARACRIDRRVLNELARLVSTLGSYATARKIDRNHQLRDFTPEEVFWIERVVHELIGRAGTVRLGKQLQAQLSLGELPPLT